MTPSDSGKAQPRPHVGARSDLGDGAEAAGLLAGSHHQQVAPLVALVIQRAGEADLARLGPHAEEAAGVDQQVVGDRQLLEGHGRHHQEAAGGATRTSVSDLGL